MALGVNYLVSPLAAGFGIDIPQADGGTLMPILMGMLGLGGMRTFEKTKSHRGQIIMAEYFTAKELTCQCGWRGYRV